MKTNGADTTIHTLPHAFVDKRGVPFLVTTLDQSRHQQLINMYLAYRPRYSFSGLPPIENEACVQWVRGLIATGINLIATSADDGVVGHAALFPIDKKRCEMLTVVSPRHQKAGIGSELIRCCIQLVRERYFERIWLIVEAKNHVAWHVYEKCGFKYLARDFSSELEMSLNVQHHTDTASIVMRELK